MRSPPAGALTFKKLHRGAMTLGMIKEIHASSLLLSLPNSLTGSVSIERISSKISAALEKIREGTTDSVELPELAQFYKKGDLVSAIILSVTSESKNGKSKRRIELSMLPSDINSSLYKEEIISTARVIAGEIESEEDRGYTVNFGLSNKSEKSAELIGFLPHKKTDDRPLFIGQSLLFAIPDLPSARTLRLSLDPRDFDVILSSDATFNSIRPGAIANAKVDSISQTRLLLKMCGLDVTVDLFHLPTEVVGRLSKNNALNGFYSIGQEIKVRIIYVGANDEAGEKIILASAKNSMLKWTNHLRTSNAAMVVGSVVERAKIVRVDSGLGVLLQLGSESCFGYCHISRLADSQIMSIEDAGFRVGSIHRCRIVDSDSYDEIFQVSLQASIFAQRFMRYEDVRAGETVKGIVKKIASYGVIVMLSDSVKAICPTAQITETQSSEAIQTIAVGASLKFKVLNVDAVERRITLTRKRGLLDSKLPALLSHASARAGSINSGYIAALKDFGAIVRFYGDVKGILPKGNMSDKFLENPQEGFFVGQVLDTKIVKCDGPSKELILTLRETQGPKKREPEDGVAEAIEDRKKAKLEKPKSNKVQKHNKVTKDEANGSKKKVERKKDNEATNEIAIKPEPVSASGRLFEETVKRTGDKEMVEDNGQQNKSMFISPSTSAPSSLPSVKEAEELEEANAKSVGVHQTTIAVSAANINAAEICEEFERRLLGSPSSSQLWIHYIATLLKAAELETARAVAERALTFISYRQQVDKMNIWLAYLNLENAYGDENSLKSVFDRACVHLDPRQVYMHMVRTYETSNKFEEAEHLFATMVKKFGGSCKVWIAFANFHFNRHNVSDARKLLPAALKALPQRKHIKATIKFAQMEFKMGSAERGRTLFEGLIANAPKRTDIWHVFIDMEQKIISTSSTVVPSAINCVRKLYGRAVSLRLSSKKMKTFFKKYLEFETRYGDEERVEHVKDLARRYVESMH